MSTKITPEEIMWVKDKLKFLGKLESYTKHDIGNNGYKVLAKSSISLVLFTVVSFIIVGIGFFLFYQTKSPLFLVSLVFLALVYFAKHYKINSLKNKNVFILLSETNNPKIIRGAAAVAEAYVFSNKEVFDDLIMWKSQKDSKSKGSLSLLLKSTTWTNKEDSKKAFKSIAFLMSNLQKTIKTNRKVYDEAVRKGISPGYGFNPANVSNQTFNNLPRPAIKPIFGEKPQAQQRQSLFGESPKQESKTNGIFVASTPNIAPLSQKPKDFVSNDSGSKTSGIFQAPQRPLFGQDEEK